MGQIQKVNGHCDRCDRLTNTTKGSYFNTDMICSICQEEEKAHPMYQTAVHKENEEVQKGNLNFAGIGLPEELKLKK
jgi:hypothetical protein